MVVVVVLLVVVVVVVLAAVVGCSCSSSSARRLADREHVVAGRQGILFYKIKLSLQRTPRAKSLLYNSTTTKG